MVFCFFICNYQFQDNNYLYFSRSSVIHPDGHMYMYIMDLHVGKLDIRPTDLIYI